MCHQPVVFTSVSGRKEEINSPAVGTVHTIAMTTAANEAHGEVSVCLAAFGAAMTGALAIAPSGTTVVIGVPVRSGTK